MKMTKTALLCAGGTGGHLFGAESLAHELRSRDWTVHLATDDRAFVYADDFPATKIHLIPSGTFFGKHPLRFFGSLLRLFLGYVLSRFLVSRNNITVSVGFGGYPTLPPMLASCHNRTVSTIIHEQNAVMGRANRFLSNRVDAIACGFGLDDDVTVTGNPVRSSVIEAASTPYPSRHPKNPFRLLVFGGSQGSRFLTDILPPAISCLDSSHRNLLHLTIQARPDDIDSLTSALSVHDIEVEIASFFSDLPSRIASSHFVISRSGAGAVSELSTIGRPALLVPLGSSLDGDQSRNAKWFLDLGGGLVIGEDELTPTKLGDVIIDSLSNPDRLTEMASSLSGVSSVDSASRLADLVESVSGSSERSSMR